MKIIQPLVSPDLLPNDFWLLQKNYEDLEVSLAYHILDYLKNINFSNPSELTSELQSFKSIISKEKLLKPLRDLTTEEIGLLKIYEKHVAYIEDIFLEIATTDNYIIALDICEGQGLLRIIDRNIIPDTSWL